MIELRVYKYNDPDNFLGVLPVRFQPQFMNQLKSTGSGSFFIPLERAQKNWELLEYRNMVKIVIDDLIVGGFLVGKQKATTITVGEKAQEVIEVIGEGIKILLDDATVSPSTGLQPNSGDTRAFNFASERGAWYNEANWNDVFQLSLAYETSSPWGQYPTDFPPNTGAYWIWGTPYSFIMPLQACYFRYEFNITNPGSYAVYAAGDNFLTIWLDGELLASQEESSLDAWHKATKLSLDLSIGDHVLAFTVANGTPNGEYAGHNPSALLMALVRNDGDAETVIDRSRTHAQWQAYINPPQAPGWAAGEVLLKLFDEAADRGVLFPQWFTPSFTATHDSDGNPWLTKLDWSFEIQESYLSVVSKLEEIGIDLWFDVATMEIHAVPQRGVNRTEFSTIAGTPVTNLAQNPSFEAATGTVVTPDGPTMPVPTGIGSTTSPRISWQDPAAAYSGAYGMRTQITQAGVAVGIQVTAQNSTSGVPGTMIMRVRPNHRTMIMTPRIRGTSGVATTFPVGEWTEVNTTVTVGGASSVSTGLLISSAAGQQIGDTIDVDTVVVTLGAYSGLIFDGNTPEDNTFTNVGWNGTVNASSSTATPLILDVTGDPPIIFERGKNLKLAELEGVGKIKNALGIRTESGWLEEEDSTSIGLYGRIEGKLDTNASPEISQSLAQLVFNQRSTPEEGASYEVIIGSQFIPYRDFNEGDWVIAPNKDNQLVPRRVISISVEEGEMGEALYTLEFDTVFQTYEEKVANFINKSTGGGSGAGLSNSSTTPAVGGNPIIIPPAPVPVTTPAAPSTIDSTSVGTWSSNGVYPTSKVTLTWTAVTLNTNGTPATVVEYQVWGYPTLLGLAGDRHLTTIVGTTAEMDGFTPGQEWTYRVRAINSVGNEGAWSANEVHTPIGPTAPMLAPTIPILSSESGLLIVKWDGKLNNGGSPIDPPPQFRYVYATVSPTSVGTYVQMGPALQRGGGQIVIPGLTLGEDYFVKLIAVDGVGIASPVSAIASIVIVGVNLGDLAQDVTDAVDAATAAAAAAQDVADDAFLLADQAAEDADEALIIANGKSKVVWSTVAPTNPATGYSTGDLWYRRDGGNQIIGIYEVSAGNWVARTITDAAITNLDAGTITAGFLAAARIQAHTISTSKLLISSDLTNMLEDPSFEAQNSSVWNLATANVTNVTTTPRTGSRVMRFKAVASAYEATRHQNAVAVEAGQRWVFGGWVRAEGAGTTVDGGLELSVVHGTVEATTSTAVAIASTPVLGATYTYVSGVWIVPAGAKFARPRIMIRDTNNVSVYLLDDVAFAKQLPAVLIEDGAIIANKIGAAAVTAEKIQAGAIAADKIQANAISAEKIQAGAITAEKLAVDAVTANSIQSGAVQTNHLSPLVGQDLDISANDTVNIISGQLSTVTDDVNNTVGQVEAMQTYYAFGPSGATISSPGSPFAVHIDNDSIDMMENGNVVSYWNSGTMYVNNMVVEKVILGNHQIEKYSDGTVVRAL